MSQIALQSECAAHSSQVTSSQCATLSWIYERAVNEVSGTYQDTQLVTIDDLRDVGYDTTLTQVNSNNSGVGGIIKNGNLYIQASNRQSGSGYLFLVFSILPIINEYSRPSGGGVTSVLTSTPNVSSGFNSSTLSAEYGGTSLGSTSLVDLRDSSNYHCTVPIKFSWSTQVPTANLYCGKLTITWANYYFSFTPKNAPSVTSPSPLTCSIHVYRMY